MVTDWVVFCDIICHVFLSLLPEYLEMVFSYYVSEPIKSHAYFSGSFLFLCSINYAVFRYIVFCHWCWWPIFDRNVFMNITFWKFSNNPPIYSSVSDAMKFIILLHSTCTGPFSGDIYFIGVLSFFHRKKYPPALLRSSGYDMQDA